VKSACHIHIPTYTHKVMSRIAGQRDNICMLTHIKSQHNHNLILYFSESLFVPRGAEAINHAKVWLGWPQCTETLNTHDITATLLDDLHWSPDPSEFTRNTVSCVQVFTPHGSSIISLWCVSQCRLILLVDHFDQLPTAIYSSCAPELHISLHIAHYRSQRAAQRSHSGNRS